MNQDSIVLGKVKDANNPPVTAFQGIDLGGIKNFLNAVHDKTTTQELLAGVQFFKPQILELVEHVAADGLLDRVAQARKEMAADDSESVLPGLQ